MKNSTQFLLGCGFFSIGVMGLWAGTTTRYPVGQPVPDIMDANDIYAYQWLPHKPEDCPGLQIKYRMEPGEYTCAVCGHKFDYGAKLNAPYDPNDPGYKFIAPAPKDWTDKFGDNERTRLLHSISELRVVVAAQGKRLMALEEWQKKQPMWTQGEPSPEGYEQWSFGGTWNPNGTVFYYKKIDPNEAKR